MIAAIAVSVLVSFTLLTPLSLFHSFPAMQRKNAVRVVATVVCASAILAALQFPFSPDFPKRIFIQHTKREWHATVKAGATTAGKVERTDSGLWVNSMDSRNIGDLSLTELRQVGDTKPVPPAGCPVGSLMCNLPWYFPVEHLVRYALFSSRSFVKASCALFFAGNRRSLHRFSPPARDLPESKHREQSLGG